MVLIIDDEAALQEVMSEILELSGIPVVCAGSGEDGTALFLEHNAQIRAVFLDLHLPGMGGLATLQSLRLINPDIDIVIMSGQPKRATMAEFSGQKHLSYLEKPFTLELLLSVVNKVFATTDGQ